MSLKRKGVFLAVLILILAVSIGIYNIVITGNVISLNVECNDGVDNDGDGLIDWQYDLGCYGNEDKSEGGLNNQLDNGWTVFEPRYDSRIIYVSSSSGNDNNDGLSPDRAVKTLYKGYSLIRDGSSDWLLFKRGDVFNEAFGNFNKDGLSADSPIVVSAYGSGERPRFNLKGQHFVGGDPSNVAFISLDAYNSAGDPKNQDFSGSKATNRGFILLSSSLKNILIEDVKLEYFGSGIVVESSDRWKQDNVNIRRSTVKNSYGGGVFIAFANNVLLEEVLLDHNGWIKDFAETKIMFNHNTYLHSIKNLRVNRIITSRASNFGIKVRSDYTGYADGVEIRDSAFIENTNAISIGGNKVDGIYQPYSTKNLKILGNSFTRMGGVINNEPQSFGVGINTVENALVEGNIFYDKPYQNSYAIKIETWKAPSKNVAVRNNIVHKWNEGTISGSKEGIISSDNKVDLSDSSYPDSSRTVYSYSSKLGINANHIEGFLDEVSKQRKHYWREEYSSDGVNNYIFAGFGMKEDLLMDPVCGDSIVNGNEQCDGLDLNGASCISRGFDSGELKCNQCIFDTGSCINNPIPQGICGDGNKADTEECDDGNIFSGDGCSSSCGIETITETYEPGLDAQYFANIRDLKYIPSLTGISPTLFSVVDKIDFPSTSSYFKGTSEEFENNFVAKYMGYIKIDTAGTYIFYLSSDDGSKLEINNELVVDNDGLHAFRERSGTKYLDVGYYPIEIKYFEAGGRSGITLLYSGPGISKKVVPSESLYRKIKKQVSVNDVCGDGIIGKTETCDGGINVCSINGYQGKQNCNSQCNGFDSCVPTEYCGDSIVNGNEQCDGNLEECVVNGYKGEIRCANDCSVFVGCAALEYCGDSIVNGNEQCDDGNIVNKDGCSGTCKIEFSQGVIAEYFDFDSALGYIPDLTSVSPEVTRIENQINYDLTYSPFGNLPSGYSNTFAARYSGFIKIDTAGTYTFYLSSDDGSSLYINDNKIVSNDGKHSVRERSGSIYLGKGYHPVKLLYFENAGGAALKFSYSGQGISKQIVPSSVFFYQVN